MDKRMEKDGTTDPLSKSEVTNNGSVVEEITNTEQDKEGQMASSQIICATCRMTAQFVCSGCKMVAYCSMDCQVSGL